MYPVRCHFFNRARRKENNEITWESLRIATGLRSFEPFFLTDFSRSSATIWVKGTRPACKDVHGKTAVLGKKDETIHFVEKGVSKGHGCDGVMEPGGRNIIQNYGN